MPYQIHKFLTCFSLVNAICPVQHDFNVIYPKYFKRVKYIMGEKPVHKAKFERAERIIANIPALSEKKGDVDFFEVLDGKCSLDEFIACLSISELDRKSTRLNSSHPK